MTKWTWGADMRIAHTVQLGHEEARAVLRLLSFHRIGLPNADDESSDDNRLRRSISAAGGLPMDRTMLVRAMDAVGKIRDAAERESSREHWEGILAASTDATITVEAPPPGSVGLVTSGTDMIGALVEARTQMLRDAQAAASVLARAYKALPEDDPYEEDEDL